jgi:hypothetical protein
LEGKSFLETSFFCRLQYNRFGFISISEPAGSVLSAQGPQGEILGGLCFFCFEKFVAAGSRSYEKL